MHTENIHLIYVIALCSISTIVKLLQTDIGLDLKTRRKKTKKNNKSDLYVIFLIFVGQRNCKMPHAIKILETIETVELK